ncbi:MAG: DUF420 domain-containing protein [Deltaproteobacteria bacterium]|nr:DUF420 domain-containing protein [Deltaproteobacteria bacterium]
MAYGKFFLQFSAAWGMLSLLLLIVAWRKAARGKAAAHKTLMIFLTAGAWLFIMSYLLRYFLPGYTPPHIPGKLIPWFALHGTVGLFPLFGASALLYARLRSPKNAFLNGNHKPLGRVTALLWCFTHIGGIVNIWLLR